jgi:FMN phosphatase YigB (HAD superfamily)
MLITVDIGSTLGAFTGDSCIEVFTKLVKQYHGAKESMVAEVTRWFLHVAPRITDELIAEVCAYLMIPTEAWPNYVNSGFRAYDDTAGALADLTTLGSVAALSNVSVLTGPVRMHDVENQLGRYLDQIFTSYALQTRKPHRRCWTTIATQYGITVGDIVHVGDRVPEDIRGALRAGCHGAILTNTRKIDVPDDLLHHPRVAVVDSLSEAVPVIRVWHTEI